MRVWILGLYVKHTHRNQLRNVRMAIPLGPVKGIHATLNTENNELLEHLNIDFCIKRYERRQRKLCTINTTKLGIKCLSKTEMNRGSNLIQQTVRTLSLRSLLAPASSSSRTQVVWPLSAAHISAVYPFCM